MTSYREGRNTIVTTSQTGQRFALMSDVHWDNAHARLDLLKVALDEALENDIPVFMFGDLFCVMQGKWDPRGNKKDKPFISKPGRSGWMRH